MLTLVVSLQDSHVKDPSCSDMFKAGGNNTSSQDDPGMPSINISMFGIWHLYFQTYTLHQKKVTFSSSIFPGDPRLGSVILGHF